MSTRQYPTPPNPHLMRSSQLLFGHPRAAAPQAPAGRPGHDCRGPATRPAPRLPRPDLSDREVEVLLAWLRTDSKAHVGRTLYIAPCTVSTHLERIRAKYAAVGRAAPTKAALAARAIQDGFVCVYDL